MRIEHPFYIYVAGVRFSICETNFELLPNLISCLLLHILLYVFSF